MRSSSVRRCRPLLGTVVEIAAAGPSEGLSRAVDRAFAAIARVHARMSFHDPESDIGQLNRSVPGHRVPVHRETWLVLQRAQRLSKQTDGVFDAAIGAELVRGRFLPTSGPAVSGTFADIDLLPGYRVRRRRAVLVDLGGIAKGFAVDQAIAVLRRAGLTSGCVNAGGDLRAFGPRPTRIDVRLPGAPGQVAPLADIEDGAVATSGGYRSRRRIGGHLRTPLLDGRTRRAQGAYSSVSVFASTCLTADALTKVVLADPVRGRRALRRHRARAVLIDRRGNIRPIV